MTPIDSSHNLTNITNLGTLQKWLQLGNSDGIDRFPWCGMTSELYSPIDPSKPVYSGRELMLVQHFLNEQGCTKLIDYAEAAAGKPAPVGNPIGGGNVGNRQDSAFIADRIDIQSDQDIETFVNSICKHIYTNVVEPYYNVKIAWFEVPHLLRYSTGGNYIAHSDCENWDPQKDCWVKGVDRDYSSVLYLNSDFTGGSLTFPYLNLRLHPQAGMLVTFPSDHRFLHAAEKTLSGQRYAFVTWAATKNSKRVMNGTPPFIVRLT